MHDKLKKILGKKRDLQPREKAAKMDVVKHLRDMASEEMGSKLDGLKKVSVMSDSKQGLAKGLDKAKQIVSNPQMDEMKNEAENPYGDLKAAIDEHRGDEDNEQKGWEDNPNQYSEGGEVEGQEESPDKGEYEAVDQGAPSEQDPENEGEVPGSEEHEELEGLDIDEIKQRIEHLMQIHKRMSEKKS